MADQRVLLTAETTVHELVLLDSFWFLIALAAFVVVEIIAESCGSLSMASVFLVIYVAVLQFGSDARPLTWLYGHPLYALAIIASYVLVGVSWGRFKWIVKCRDEYLKSKAIVAEWLSRRRNRSADALIGDGVTVPDQLEKEFKTDYCLGDPRDPIKIAANKEWFIQTAIYWPFGMAWFFLNDFLHDVFTAIYNRIAGILQADADRIYKSLKP